MYTELRISKVVRYLCSAKEWAKKENKYEWNDNIRLLVLELVLLSIRNKRYEILRSNAAKKPVDWSVLFYYRERSKKKKNSVDFCYIFL